ncbi:hypothetical protein C3747_2g415 [Trypanosoma cruzi]|uniref:Uncharacterized protein n=1 Tax=Trypanosoma cruzi TaxID=5693 RepID=A0A2V2XLS1_TRYCR|nr:hypothetical protein C3747_2g415 [Trypanosoma cruzi]
MPSAGFSADRTYAKDTCIPRESKNSYIRCSSHVKACDFELPLFAAPCSEVLSIQTSTVRGRMAEKANRAKRTARASACMIRKGLLSHFPPAILTSPESGIKTAPHPWSDAFVMMAADAFSVELMIRLRLFPMMCRNPSPKPIAAGGRFAGDVSCTIPQLSADNRRRTALLKKR